MQYRGGVNELMRQASRMQRKVEEVKRGLKEREVSATAIEDKITVVVTCEGKVRSVVVDPALVAAEGLEFALDGVVVATNAALTAADKLVDAELAKVTGGMKIPGVTG